MSDAPSRISCPECGGPTCVLETRAIDQGLRRRRACNRDGCTARLTTLEVVVGAAGVRRKFRGVDHVLVPRQWIEALAGLLRTTEDE